MWRRVQCEQLLDTGQSLLRLRGNPIKLCGVFILASQDHNYSRKGMRFLFLNLVADCLLYTSPSPRDKRQSRMPSSA